MNEESRRENHFDRKQEATPSWLGKRSSAVERVVTGGRRDSLLTRGAERGCISPVKDGGQYS
jgi:hypothetical protein